MASFDGVVPPGQAGTIRASVHTANYRGAIGKTITVTHDDASQGPISLAVKANVIGSVNVYPYTSLTLSQRLKGWTTPGLLLVRKDETESGDLAVENLTASVPWLKVTSRRVATDEPAVEGLPAARAGDYVISVLVDKPPVGIQSQQVTFTTGLSREPHVTIPVLVQVRSPISLQPSEMILQPVAGSPGTATGQVLAAVREDLDPKAVAVVSDDPAFVVRIDPPGERAFRLSVDWAGAGKSAPTETKVHLRVGGESVDLPVRVNLSRVSVTPEVIP